jgi:ComF family protein
MLTYGICMVCGEKTFGGLTHLSCLHNENPTSIFSPFLYKDKVRECIVRAKYAAKEFAALRALTHFGVNFYTQTGPVLDNFVVISVPISWARYKSRGFNQVDIVSKVLAKRLGLAFEDRILVRQKETLPQAGQQKFERMQNVKDAFGVISATKVVGRKFLLVDDICTTGATLKECSKVLYVAGALEVRCFTVARVL